MPDIKRIRSVNEIERIAGHYVIDINGVDINFNFSPSKDRLSSTLILGFHGSVNRQKRDLPSFMSFLPSVDTDAHQICIADPSLNTDSNLSMSWFAGHDGFLTQDELRGFILNLCGELKVNRTIYFGTSGGGFAALFYSYFHENSLALVGNPQTAINKYFKSHIDKYLASCWPDSEDFSSLDGVITYDLQKLYGVNDIKNTVVYLQNSTDYFHLYKHMLPFLLAIKSNNSRKRILPDCSFHGSFGHSPNWEMFSLWVRAALCAPDWSSESLFKSYELIKRNSIQVNNKAEVHVKKKNNSKEVSEKDTQFARALADYHLNNKENF